MCVTNKLLYLLYTSVVMLNNVTGVVLQQAIVYHLIRVSLLFLYFIPVYMNTQINQSKCPIIRCLFNELLLTFSSDERSIFTVHAEQDVKCMCVAQPSRQAHQWPHTNPISTIL